MATTVDHLRVDHRIKVLREFADAEGTTLRAGDRGLLRMLSLDLRCFDIRMEIVLEDGRKVALRFSSQASSGPRNGRMKEYFELGDYVPNYGQTPKHPEPSARKMIVPGTERETAGQDGPAWWRRARGVDGRPDRLEAVEQQIQREAQHIGAAASIAEMYAQRMRAFQRAGNEDRAAAAFKLAMRWMQTYASQATSGGEGVALSRECEQFHAALVREFGYDPTDAKSG